MNDYSDKLIQYALRILSKKRYTTFEMEQKLSAYAKKRKALRDELIAPVIERLKDLDYLDDEQFVRDYIAERVRLRPRGKSLIRRELKFKGVSKDLVEQAFETVEIDEFELAHNLLSRKLSRWRKIPIQKQKMKAYQLLYSKGFEGKAIYKAIDDCYNQHD